MAEIHGFCDDKFTPVRDVLAQSIDQGEDLGASFAVTIDGEMVVDIWGGHVDEQKTRPWQSDTIVNVYSSTKTMSFLCALVLADRGRLDFDANVADYWPEFAQNGKDKVKVWHFMNHAAGLSGLDIPMAGEDNYDWDKVVSALAAQAPWWEPGTATGYHAMTQGYLIGELVRRISGKSLGTFFQDEIAGPLQADFFIGLPTSEFSRTSRLVVPERGNDLAAGLEGTESDSIPVRTFASPYVEATDSWTDGWRQAEIPAANGHGNARAIATSSAAGLQRIGLRCELVVESNSRIGDAGKDFRARSCAGCATGIWAGVWPEFRGGTPVTEQKRLFLGRLGRLQCFGGSRCSAQRIVRYEPHVSRVVGRPALLHSGADNVSVFKVINA